MNDATRKLLKEALIGRDGGPICRYCGTRCYIEKADKEPGLPMLTIDHVVPKSHGGGDDMDNLVLACAPCNSRKKSTPFAEFMAMTEPLRQRKREYRARLVERRNTAGGEHK